MTYLIDINSYVPETLRNVCITQELLPRIAKEHNLIKEIEYAVARIPTTHKLYRDDARNVVLKPTCVHLVLTSPPYWTLKKYPEVEGQLGLITDYRSFLKELDKVWRRCYRALVPGGRLICVVGDVCLSRRANNGKHTVIPLHSSIQEQLIRIGFSNLAPILWYKITNANYEANRKTRFLGKPYEPGGIIKNDVEFIIMARKPGAYRKVTPESRILSVISDRNHREWFRQIWSDIAGASTRIHPAPFPLQLAERLVRMFSFVGDVVVDPFMGTGSTNVAASKWGRNSIGIEVDSSYFNIALNRLNEESNQCHHVNIAIERKK
ncbi:MAG: site-specific DNA-methyltransferase [Chloroflexi bacterium]|nr:site-specific DNA-methyltransferase [Chloroflexota bacterium]